MHPARWLFFVVVASKAAHHAHVGLLIRGAQDLFAAFGARAKAVEDADRRDESSGIRVASPLDSQHVAKTNVTLTDRTRRSQWDE